MANFENRIEASWQKMQKHKQKKVKSGQPLKKNPTVYRIKLSAKDEKLLLRYCAANKVSQTTAIKRILRSYLTETLEHLEEDAPNQLDLFAPKQMNIFDCKA